MSARVLLGKPVADAIRADVSARAAALARRGRVPVLATLRVGERPEDVAYERSIERTASALGIRVVSRSFSESAGTGELARAIADANADERVSGCMLFRPLPTSIDEASVCNAVAVGKDVDGVSAASLAGVFAGDGGTFAPATAEACMEVLAHYGVPVAGRRVAVVGRSLVVGRPVSMLLLSHDATVTVCHSRTLDLADVTREADIVVCAVGRARFFDASYFREGQTVLDVGVNDDGAGGLVGDVDFDSVANVCDAITPVPRGVGSVSTSVLFRHAAIAAERMSAEV